MPADGRNEDDEIQVHPLHSDRQDLREAYLAGQDARFDGREISSCPHPEGSELDDVWRSGWLDEDLIQNDAANP